MLNSDIKRLLRTFQGSAATLYRLGGQRMLKIQSTQHDNSILMSILLYRVAQKSKQLPNYHKIVLTCIKSLRIRLDFFVKLKK